MPNRFAVLALAVATALVVAAPAARAEDAAFDFRVAGIPVGEMTLRSQQSGDGYTASSRVDAVGMLGAFANFFFEGEATGRLRSDGRVVPDRYVATSQSPRALRRTVIDWEDGTPVQVSVEPPRSTAPDPASQAGALDPVSAGFRLLRDAPPETLCDTTVFIFDGSRRSQLALSAPVVQGDVITCEATYARVEGESHSLGDRREAPFRFTFRRGADGLARFERAEAPTRFGQAVIVRRD